MARRPGPKYEAMDEFDREELRTDHRIQRRGFKGKPRGSWNVRTTQDDSMIRLSFGKHKGEALPVVPTHYRRFAFERGWVGPQRGTGALRI